MWKHSTSFLFALMPKYDSPSFLFFVLSIHQYILDTAIKKGTKVIQRYGADGLVVLQSVKQTAAHPVCVDQPIGRDTLFLHCFV